MKTASVVYEEVLNGELRPDYMPISIYPKDGETFEGMFRHFCPEGIFKGVFEDRNDAMRWIENWKPFQV
jgi:hypothetical protein